MKPIYTTALKAGRTKPRDVRNDIATKGMDTVLSEFIQRNSGTRSSGVKRCSTAAAGLLKSWRASTVGCEQALESLLDTAQAEIDLPHNNPLSLQEVSAIFWQAAWAYSAHHFKEEARAVIELNRNNGTPIRLNRIVFSDDPLGNPYEFPLDGPGSGYIIQAAPDVLYRGDRRSPEAIRDDGGFMGRYAGGGESEKFLPFYDANSNGCTISFCSLDEAKKTSLQAGGKFAKVTSSSDPVAVTDRITALVETLAGEKSRLNRRVASYLYEVTPQGETIRNADNPYGKEEMLLGVPNNLITRYWIILSDYSTIGPITYRNNDAATATLSKCREIAEPLVAAV